VMAKNKKVIKNSISRETPLANEPMGHLRFLRKGVAAKCNRRQRPSDFFRFPGVTSWRAPELHQSQLGRNTLLSHNAARQA